VPQTGHLLPDFTLPGTDDRTAIIGRTGSGKTQLAVWLLSMMPIASMPWVVIDYKGDELVNAIERAIPITYDVVPVQPGIYILRVLPGEESELSDWFRRVWEVGGIGIYVDEGYMIERNDKYFNACLTQGRSKRIPMIILTQRPLWLSRFVFSEASYFFIFDITHSKDRGVVKEYVKDDERGVGELSNKDKVDVKLDKYHSWYYDVGNDTMMKIGPVPASAEILATIDRRLPAEEKRRGITAY
jgi:DNA helicase HerA-like ATPase